MKLSIQAYKRANAFAVLGHLLLVGNSCLLVFLKLLQIPGDSPLEKRQSP
jgi:hypothetical protein